MAAAVKMGRRLVVLIDADNVSAARVTPLLAEIANFGTATVRRIYGDWTTPNLNSWKQERPGRLGPKHLWWRHKRKKAGR